MFELLPVWARLPGLRGIVLITVIAFAGSYGGLRAGMISTAFLTAYVFAVHTWPFSVYGFVPATRTRETLVAGVFFSLVALIAGVVQGKLLNARVREFDAQAAARKASDRQLQTESSLKRSRELQRLVVESALDAIVAIDSEGAVTMWNPVAERMFGWSSTEAVGRPLTDLIVPDGARNEPEDGIVRFLATGEGRPFGRPLDFKAVDRNGTLHDVEVCILPHETDDGHVFVGFIRDVGERKRQDAAIRKLNEDLELRVAQRTLELEEQRKIAVEASRIKSEFVASMSHELRTPLNGVLGFAQILQMQYGDPEIQESSAAIIKAGKHLLNLINEILDLAKIESGQMTVSLEPVRVDEVVSEALDLLGAEAARGKISVSAEAATFRGINVLADRRRFLQAVLNVLANAVKYNRPGGSVIVWGAEQADSRFEVYIADTGPGISESDQKSLFQAFVRFGDGTVEGSGLGLTLSKNLLDLMGGKVRVVSSGPEGTVFAVSLKTAAAYGAGVHLPSREMSVSTPSLDGAKVLYIEDNAANFLLLEKAFANWGNVRLTGARTGEEGLEAALASVPDLILLDLHLPDVPGEDVLRRLKGDPVLKDVPVVVVSAVAGRDSIERLVSLGADDYVTKPVDLSRLAAVVEGLLSVRRPMSVPTADRAVAFFQNGHHGTDDRPSGPSPADAMKDDRRPSLGPAD
ncbi:MAG: PAS domain S-box protein [Armatimonadetes bacterium]|nr:PAS domain S-box protein [Armatimonadota bacterium]